MNNISLMEKTLKRFLKKKLTINTSNIVKYLLVGIASLSVTACGGGGGGSSTSTSNNIFENKGHLTATAYQENKTFYNNGTIDISKENPIGIVGVNSNIVNNNDIKITNSNIAKFSLSNEKTKDILEQLENSGYGIGILSQNGKTTNGKNGNIILNGNNTIGMAGINSEISNAGNIINDNGNSNSIGVLSLGSNVSNSGTITLTGSNLAGIYGINGVIKNGVLIGSDKDIVLENSGFIKVTSNAQNSNNRLGYGMYLEGTGKAINNGNIEFNSVLYAGKDYLNSDKFRGMTVSGENAIAINKGNITFNQRVEQTDSFIKSTVKNNSLLIGMQVDNFGKVENDGVISGSGKIIGMVAEAVYSEANKEESNSSSKVTASAVNNKDIILDSVKVNGELLIENGGFYNYKYDKYFYTKVVGLQAYNKGSEVENRGNITLIGAGTGINVENNGVGINNGNITVTSKEIHLIGTAKNDSEPTRPYLENIKGWSRLAGMSAKNASIKNKSNGKITVDGAGYGMIALNSSIYNGGEIVVTAKDEFSTDSYYPGGKIPTDYKYKDSARVAGIIGMGGEIINEGKITVTGGDGIGIGAIFGNTTATNEGTINITGESSIGMLAATEKSDKNFDKNSDVVTNGKNGKINVGKGSRGMVALHGGNEAINDGTINLLEGALSAMSTSRQDEEAQTILLNRKTGVINIVANSKGMIGATKNSELTNEGIINVNGENSYGMVITRGNSKATNKGTINVNGKDSIGMVVTAKDSEIVNDGIIKVSKDAKYAMYASDGGKIINNNTIYVDSANPNQKEATLKVENGGILENKGTIETNGNISINKNGFYEIGTDKNGNYGTLSANNVEVDGSVTVSTDIAKGDYKNSYVLNDVFKGNNVEITENAIFKTNSLLYSANLSKDEGNNVDATLTKNKDVFYKYASDNLKGIGKIIDNGLDNYNSLNQKEKEFVDKLSEKTTIGSQIKESIEKISGKEYLDNGKQIFEIKDNFLNSDDWVVSNMGTNSVNAMIIGDYSKTDSKHGLIGYKSKMIGFDSALKIKDDLFATLGYGFSKLDYNNSSDGKIQTLHAGLYKYYKYDDINIKFGTYGEYNFHDINRESLENKNKVKFNSYLLGIKTEVSKKYGTDLYLTPKFTLDVTYGNIDKFTEDDLLKVSKQDYLSCLPKLEMEVGKQFENVVVYGVGGYSYELGDMNKDMKVNLLSQSTTIKGEDLKVGLLKVALGTKVNFDSINIDAEIGKEFGKREQSYAKVGLGYKF